MAFCIDDKKTLFCLSCSRPLIYIVKTSSGPTCWQPLSFRVSSKSVKIWRSGG